MVSLLFLGLIAGCSSGWKPDEEKATSSSSYRMTPDGYYRVRRGDTLHAIAFNLGMDWKDIAAWNNISSPYTIYPDQELRLTGRESQGSQKKPTTATAPSGGSDTAKSGADSKSSSSGTVIKAAPGKSPTSTTRDHSTGSGTIASAATSDPDLWLWPVEGRIISNFEPNDPARKGIDIGGSEGQAITASASGEVVYSGSGLIGYGELIIIKHSESLLSAYAHNKTRLVKEGQRVAGGERIAEMGRNDRNQAMLHFEIRLNGNPQDPLKYLPDR
jgi:lipoprotein NlpD